MTLAGTDKIIFKHQLPQNATASFHIKQKKAGLSHRKSTET